MGGVKERGISGGTLKWIAVISMFIDHAAAILIEGGWDAGVSTVSYQVYLLLRGVGRLAFPIYCFLLSEGYLHTGDVKKYLLRLLLFGLISEVPFDLAFCRSWMDFSYQNVYCTLFLGLLAIRVYELMSAKGERYRIPALLAAAVWALLAELAETDYGAAGVALILVIYILRERPALRVLGSASALLCSSSLEAFAFLDLPLLSLYNGRRGRQPKYFFYVFYPAHLLLLVGIRYWLFKL